MRRHTERFLEQLDTSCGYDYWQKIPVLIDWNLGNFSVEYHQRRFELFSRWDYDWFRIEPRHLDFYFLSRVSSRTGDRTRLHLRMAHPAGGSLPPVPAAYHRVFPLDEQDDPVPARRRTGSSS